ncbi:MAG TPA: hypothetical protein DEF88_04925, partial [Porphyromonadaceae bacterium]|nr:hypothetical protein [Porphyromonadaceae bacterium]
MKTKSITLTVLVMLLMMACSKEDKIVYDSEQVQFISHVSALQTRTTSGGDQWVKNDPVGIYMIKNGTTLAAENILEKADNRQYKAASGDVFATGFNPAAPDQTIYYPTEGKVDFVAYYPYKSNEEIKEGYKYPVDVRNQTEQADIDLLYAKANGYDKATTGPVKLTFEHKLSKLVIQVKKGESLASVEGLQVKKIYTAADLELSTGDLKDFRDEKDITLNKNGDTYEAILLPVAALEDKHSVEFELDGDDYKWQINKNITDGLKAGKKYVYTITVTKSGVEVEGEITPWGEVTGDAEAVIKPIDNLFVYGDVILAGKLEGAGYRQEFAEIMEKRADGSLELLIYNHKENGEFLFISSRGSDAEIYGKEGENGIKKNSEEKFIIPEKGYHKIIFDRTNKTYSTEKIDPADPIKENVWIWGDGFVEITTAWNVSGGVQMDKHSENPNLFIKTITRNQNDSPPATFRLSDGTYTFNWKEELNLDNFASHSFVLGGNVEEGYAVIPGNQG